MNQFFLINTGKIFLILFVNVLNLILVKKREKYACFL
jgi:hypothetical protein